MHKLACATEQPRSHVESDLPPGIQDLLDAAALSGVAQEVPAAQGGVGPVKAVTDEVQRTALQREHLPVALHVQAQLLLHELSNRSPCTVQSFLVGAEDHDVVHVAHHVLHAGQGGDVPVEGFKVEVRQPLADEESDAESLFAGGEDVPCELQELLVLDLPGHGPDQLLAVYAVVVVVDVHLADILGTLLVLLDDALDVLLGARSSAARYGSAAPRIHPAHDDGLHGHDHQGMNDAIRKETHILNLTPFLAGHIVHAFLAGCLRRKLLIHQQVVHLIDVFSFIGKNLGYITTAALADRADVNCLEDALLVAHPLVKESDSLGQVATFLPCSPARRFEKNLLGPVLNGDISTER